MLKAIVFDFDGVLVDSEPLHYRAFLDTARPLGVEFDYQHYLQRYVGFDDRDGFRAMLSEAGATVADLDATVDDLCLRKRDRFRDIVEQGFEVIPGVLDFIDRLPADLPLAIASGATRHDIDLILGAIGIGQRFDPIVSATDVSRSKPDPQTYRLTVEGLARRIAGHTLSPHECLAIEDTASGIESARGAGLITLGVTTTTKAEDLHRAHRVVDEFEGLTLAQLQEWFG